MKKICFVTASPLTLRAFMRNHMLRLAEQYEVTAVSDFNAEDLLGDWLPGVRLIPIPIARQINLLADIRALVALLRFFRSERFDVVHSITPKAGLLAMTAARLAGLSHRVHCFTGQVWATRSGLGRFLLKNADRAITLNANHLMADGLLQREFLEREGIALPGKIEVLGRGSSGGFDLNRFKPDAEIRKSMRNEWCIPQTACLLLFIGRLNRDKGVLDLAKAFVQLARDNNDVWLIMVGPDEAEIGIEFEKLCDNAITRVRRVNYTTTPEYAMAAADLLVMPSYREGFNNVVMEAAACSIPAVASRIYGLTDAIEENITGLLHPPGDIAALRECLHRLCIDSELRLKMGNAARIRVQLDFSMETVTAAFVAYYEKILGH